MCNAVVLSQTECRSHRGNDPGKKIQVNCVDYITLAGQPRLGSVWKAHKNIQHKHFAPPPPPKNPILGCDPSRHLQDPPGPKSQKSLKKGLLGGPQKSPRKYPKKSKNTQNCPKIGIFGLFQVFFETFLQTPQKTFFETFLRFRARRVRRLL